MKKRKFILYFTLLILLIIYFLRPFRFHIVNGTSMEPTLKNGEIVFININSKPKINDLIVFKYNNILLIKRIKIIHPPKYYFYYKEKTQDIILYYLLPSLLKNTNKKQAIKFKNDEVWVEGDNINNSEDSRIFGPIRQSDIVGVVINRD